MKRLLSLLLMTAMLFSVLPASALTFDDLLQKADAYIQAEDYEKALACYQLAVNVEPDAKQGYLGAADLYLRMDDAQNAYLMVDALLEKNPVSADAWLMKCKIDIASGNVSSFETDRIFAEVCDVSLETEYPAIADMYAAAGSARISAAYFGMADFSSLTEEQRDHYRKALVSLGQREQAAALGLTASIHRNSKLDAAFENNALRLVKTELQKVTADAFEFPDELWTVTGFDPQDALAEMEAAIAQIEFTYLSLSQAGNSGILCSDGNVGFSWYQGKFHILYPSASTGVADEYGNFEIYMSYLQNRITSLLSEEGVVYSPDGRYAAISNNLIVLATGNFFIDPILIDLSTGAVNLLSTSERKPLKGGSAVTTSCFSQDGKYYYYILLGGVEAHKCSMYRYDMLNKTTELCVSEYDFTYYPTLSETADGRHIIINDTQRKDGYTGIVSMMQENNRWTSETIKNTLPRKYWFGNRLMYSANSGFALIPGSALSQAPHSLKCFMPDEDFKGFTQCILISNETNQPILLSDEEWAVFLENLNPTGAEEILRVPYHAIDCCRLSPDGFYALLLTQNTAPEAMQKHLYLLRLEDLALREISGIDASSILTGVLGSNYAPNIEWNTDTLLIGTENGVVAYRFDD